MEFEIDGVRYAGWHQVPAEVRAQLAKQFPDGDGDGVPDLFEGTGSVTRTTTTSSIASSVTVDGREYTSADEIPEEVKQALRRAGVPLPGGTSAANDHHTAPTRTVPPVSSASEGPIGTRPPRKWWQVWRHD